MAQRGAGERTAYRCPRCNRRRLVLELLADDIAGELLTRRDARALAGQLERAGLDSRGVCIVIGRLKAQHAAASWARVLANVAKVEAGL